MNMNKFNSKAIAFLLVILLVLGSAPAAFANGTEGSADQTTGIIYKGKSVADDVRWFFQKIYMDEKPEAQYTATDLFSNPEFKNVMPGDELTQDFIVKNESRNRIKLYMDIVAHDGVSNKLSDKVAAKTTTEQMIKFLNQMELKVTADGNDGPVTLFQIPEGELGTFTSKESAVLGTLAAGTGTTLHVDLKVSKAMTSDFDNEIGEIDFKFTIEEYSSGGGGGNPPKEEEIDDPDVPLDGPDEPTVIPGEPVEDIPDPKVPLGDAPKTGDNTKILPLMLLMIAALAGLVTTRKKLN